MANLFDYLYWRGDLSLECLPFNAVDGLILAWFSSMPLQAPVPERLGEASAALAERSELENDSRRFVRMLAESRRFREMELREFESKFSESEEMQFAAITVLTGDGHAFVAYRGTDSTLVGWKEDFNMAFSDEVPAQREATRYLNAAAAKTALPLRVGGHSKGGNLAVYASARCDADVRARITITYNYDGPGLSPSVMESQGYQEIEPRIETWLPGSSIVGILLERSPRYSVVRSSNVGPMQHSPYSWQVTPDGFERLQGLDAQSLYADRTIRDWLGSMSREQRRDFVEALYDIVGATEARTVEEVGEHWQESGWKMLNAFSEMDLRTKAMLFLSVGKLLRSAVRNLTAE